MKKSLQERLEAAQRKREAAVKAMGSIYEAADSEGRGLSEDEQKQFDDHRHEVTRQDQELKNIGDLVKLELGAPTGTTRGQEIDSPRASGVDLGDRMITGVSRNLQKGAAFTRFAMALAASKGNPMAAERIALERYRSTPEVAMVLKAAVAAGTTTDTTWAAPLVEYQNMQSEFIELLRPMTVMGQMSGFRAIPFNVRMPRQTSGASANWVGQGAPNPVSRLNFDAVTMPHSKLAVIVAITEELARMSSPSAEATVRQDLLETVSQFIDVQFLDPTIAGSTVRPGGVTNGITVRESTGLTVAQITNDLNFLLTAMTTGNIAMRAPYWVLHTRTKNFLMTLRTSQDVYAFRDEMARGTLLGIPFVSSNNMPLRDQDTPVSPASLEGYIFLMDASEIFMADDGETMLDVSREASLQMDDAPTAGAASLVSLWQNNMVGIRAERYIHWKRRRDAAVGVISKVAY